MNENDQKEFERRTRELFDQEVAGIDAATRSKLNRARQRALCELERPAFSLLRAPMPQAAAAAVVVAAVAGALFMRGGVLPEAGMPDVAEATDIEILLAEDDMEFLEEIEFYAWLEAQPEFQALEDTGEGAG
jgi:hypothetical protein